MVIVGGDRRRRIREALFLAAVAGSVLLPAACARRSARSGAEDCVPPAGDASPEGPDVSALAGRYRVVLVAESGSRAGQRTSGALELRAVREPRGGGEDEAPLLLGRAAFDPEAVGAVRVGALDTDDPAAPGVAVFRQRGRLLLRFGSDANRRGVLRFDGAYFVGWVDRVGGDGFSGRWESGVAGPEARGTLCAQRLAR